MSVGDVAGARARMSRLKKCPDYRPVDTFILDLMGELCSPISQGCQLEVLRMRCKAVGITSEAGRLEVWERVGLAYGAVSEMQRALAAAQSG